MKQEKYEYLKMAIEDRIEKGKWFIDLERGRIFTNKGRELGKTIHNNGYKFMGVCLNGRNRGCFVHDVITVAGGLNPVNLTINHIDGDKLNNKLSNLEVVTQGENVRHSIRTGLNTHTRLSEDTVRFIKTLLLQGVSKAEISRMLNVSTCVLRGIDKGRTYKWVVV